MRFAVSVAALLGVSPAALLAAPAAPAAELAEIVSGAEADQPERDYLPESILVTGRRSGYSSDDGSTAYSFTASVLELEHWSVDAASIRCTQTALSASRSPAAWTSIPTANWTTA